MKLSRHVTLLVVVMAFAAIVIAGPKYSRSG